MKDASSRPCWTNKVGGVLKVRAWAGSLGHPRIKLELPHLRACAQKEYIPRLRLPRMTPSAYMDARVDVLDRVSLSLAQVLSYLKAFPRSFSF